MTPAGRESSRSSAHFDGSYETVEGGHPAAAPGGCNAARWSPLTVSPARRIGPCPGLDPWVPRLDVGASLPTRTNPAGGKHSVPGRFFSRGPSTPAAEAPSVTPGPPLSRIDAGATFPTPDCAFKEGAVRCGFFRRTQQRWHSCLVLGLQCATRDRRREEPPAIAAGVASRGWSAPWKSTSYISRFRVV